jgi:tetratricopeptide (TPR) repeat protein
MMKKEFLFDADGAYVSLQTARSLAKDSRIISEIDNLIGIYGYERDSAGSISTLKRIADENAKQYIFRFNQGLAFLRSGKYAESTAVLTSLAAAVRGDEELSHDVSLLLGWSRDLGSKGADANAEAAYIKALEINPASALARLGLAIYRLRKFGMKEAEADFRMFIELAPELEGPSRVVNFRKMSNFDLYNLARKEIRDLNTPGGVVGAKPSPLVMAVDALLSSIQSRTNEATKILEVALTHAPGDTNILKAVAYVRWKDGRYDDVIDLLRDLTKEKNSFSANLLLGKSYAKTGKKSLAEKHFLALSSLPLAKGEGWSSIGELQLSQGSKIEAKKSFQSALSRDPKDLVALKGLSRLGEETSLDSEEIESNLPF